MFLLDWSGFILEDEAAARNLVQLQDRSCKMMFNM